MKVFKQLFDRQIDEQSAWNAWLILNFGHFVELLLPLGCLGYRGRIRSISINNRSRDVSGVQWLEATTTLSEPEPAL
jgi:hypothetical protein